MSQSRISEILEDCTRPIYDNGGGILGYELDDDKAEAAINAYIAEVIGNNESYNRIANKQFNELIGCRNQLRAEQRNRAGLTD